jgi:hypothetical protein
MYQINNLNDNTVINIEDLNIKNNRIVYNIQDVNGAVLDRGEYKPAPNLWDQTFNPFPLNEFGIDQLKANIFGGSEFEKSADLQNWIHTSRNIRLIVDNQIILDSLSADNDLAGIILRMRDENAAAVEKFIFKNEKTTIIYINEILSADAPIVEPYILSGDIIQQNKEV